MLYGALAHNIPKKTSLNNVFLKTLNLFWQKISCVFFFFLKKQPQQTKTTKQTEKNPEFVSASVMNMHR